MTFGSIPHAPLGAHACFNFGPAGAPAGFAVPATAAVHQDVFVGCRASAAEPWSLLPFFTPAPGGPAPLPRGRFGRFFAAAGDKWMIGPLVFKLCTAFPAATDPIDELFDYAPVVCGYLEYDNSHSSEVAELVFGVGGTYAALDTASGMTGFTAQGGWGCATPASAEVGLRRDATLLDAPIGPAAGWRFIVPAQARRLFPFVLGFHQPGLFHSSVFADLASVLAHGLREHPRYLARANARDSEFMRSTVAPDVKVRAVVAVREWLAQSRRAAGEPALDLQPLHQLWRSVTG